MLYLKLCLTSLYKFPYFNFNIIYNLYFFNFVFILICIFLLEIIPLICAFTSSSLFFTQYLHTTFKWFVMPVALTAISFYYECLALIVC
jgi:hypothetical protein